MISKEQMFPMLIAADPSYLPRWRAFQDDWKTDSDPPLYVALGDLADHMVNAMIDGNTEAFEKIFDAVEQWISEGDEYVANAAVVGLLEGIQNICGHRKQSANPFLRWLGPETRKGWDALNIFWHGTSDMP